YRGVTVRFTPTVMQKYLETPLHALTSFLDLFRRQCDVVLLCNAANSPFAWLGRLRGLPVCINVDGIERKRAKWNALGRMWYRLGELCSVLFATKVIADAEVIAEYYRKCFKASPVVLTYGARAERQEGTSLLGEFGLSPNSYVLYVSRLEPENNALGVIQAYGKVKSDYPLVIVGDAPYAKDYIESLHSAADERVVFTGYQFGTAYQELQTHARLYVQATEVGGTHPALIEAMAYGNCIIANGTPENREVLSNAGAFYEVNDFDELAHIMQGLIDDEEELDRFGGLAKERAQKCYEWNRITDQYEQLFLEVV
ncbi:MAG: glycosyltransferase, partial [Bdellovibrionales bacterium]|nr:glycosyltransferase [Bdellovibrionales bacterium]